MRKLSQKKAQPSTNALPVVKKAWRGWQRSQGKLFCH
jgi:hypothetical protein